MTAKEPAMEREAIHRDLERVRSDLQELVARTSADDLRRRTNGTRWTNQQMLWHMVFGFEIVSRLLPLVRFFGRAPDPFGRAFAGMLNALTRPFHLVNYVGGVGGAMVFHGHRLTRLCDQTINALQERLDAETPLQLVQTMPFPVGWDPFFRDVMSLEDVYRYGAQHYDFHRAQLSITQTGP